MAPITEHALRTERHTSFYLASGPEDGTTIIFVHGWPELAVSWRGQLPVFGGLGFRAIAPDMRGYGRSSVYDTHDAYAIEQSTADMIELLDSLGKRKAIWVGHDWGTPVVWSIAQHHPDRCHGVAGLCVPYLPEGFGVETAVPLSNRTVYPEDQFPAAQWDYQLYYRENFAEAQAAFEADALKSVRALFRAGDPAQRGKPSRTAQVRAFGGWFGGGPAPDVPRDPRILSEEDELKYAAALTRNGFFGPGSWYMNAEANMAFAETARANWRLEMPVLFLHAAHDHVCDTIGSDLAHPMREHVANLSEVTIQSGHWMAQERPTEVNAALARWLGQQFPAFWRTQ